ncbi:hypothetical protein BC477_13000 [Clavibacter michiganensis subsp. michiganensis]|uniref:Uncharacterized protein n=1 Tax=Clavibacter michiganensis subsp. michiganensis TaxID=33013 RepID=A0A251XIJ7_CLAMM|nr:hypothetical protein BC477_13000 [Clavibacter michiganensis subsp. michiganensis]OUE02713.1 hypothetical protein CMMCAS07_11905 [Clavibacter michiganensis subsp. michiganensis]
MSGHVGHFPSLSSSCAGRVMWWRASTSAVFSRGSITRRYVSTEVPAASSRIQLTATRPPSSTTRSIA